MLYNIYYIPESKKKEMVDAVFCITLLDHCNKTYDYFTNAVEEFIGHIKNEDIPTEI